MTPNNYGEPGLSILNFKHWFPALRTPKMTWAKLSTLSFTFTLGTEETPVDSTIMFLTDTLLFHFWNTDAITD